MAGRVGARSKGQDTPTLTPEHVIAATLAFIDEHGLEAFSMRTLARELGVYPTALYWHTTNRDELLGRAIGLALQEIEAPGAGDWAEWLSEFARRFRLTLHRHPNLASIVGSQMVSRAVSEFNIIEIILAKLAEAGFAGDSLVDAYNVILGSVVGFVSIELVNLPGDPNWSTQMEAEVRNADPAVYPQLAANVDRMADRAFGLRWSRGTEAPLDGAFELLLTVVMRGLRERLDGG